MRDPMSEFSKSAGYLQKSFWHKMHFVLAESFLWKDSNAKRKFGSKGLTFGK